MIQRVALALMLGSGCYKTTLEGFAEHGGPGTTESRAAHTLLGGLITTNRVDAEGVCGEMGVWSISTRMNGVSLLATIFTAGIYTPMYARITCNAVPRPPK
jgi:hypothetical protein